MSMTISITTKNTESCAVCRLVSRLYCYAECWYTECHYVECHCICEINKVKHFSLIVDIFKLSGLCLVCIILDQIKIKKYCVVSTKITKNIYFRKKSENFVAALAVKIETKVVVQSIHFQTST